MTFGVRTVIMRKIIYLLLVIVALASCSKSESRYDKEISQAERLMPSNPDSALAILESIDPSDLKVDSLRAKPTGQWSVTR